MQGSSGFTYTWCTFCYLSIYGVLNNSSNTLHMTTRAHKARNSSILAELNMRPAFALLALLFVFLFAATTSESRRDPEKYWKMVMKDQKMPEGIHGLLQLTSENNPKTEEQLVEGSKYKCEDEEPQVNNEFEPRPSASKYDDFEPRPSITKYNDDFEPRPRATKYDDFEPRPSITKYNDDFEPRPSASKYND
ncbi:hypothetical protein VNO77_36143 [Canavalia gladiata]|uniref:Organ-specific protein S2-like n=1 Tax=Canavalia gladiata TaxID=3824 RepID=A0AAN9KA53_CANGL